MNRDEWITLSRPCEVKVTEKKSIFIAYAAPIHSQEEAEGIYLRMKKKYPDARHHVYAWRIGNDTILERHSDAGEPAGTAGLPVLEVLRKNQIDDAIIVVTRYFGGILLGTGGLLRAYTKSATLAVSEAVPVACKSCNVYNISVSYSNLERIRYILKKNNFLTEEPRFEADPILPVFCEKQREEELFRISQECTSGEAHIVHCGKHVVETRISEAEK